MRSEGFSFYILGVWGWKRVRWTLLGVRNRPRSDVVRSSSGVYRGKFKVSQEIVMSFRVAWLALCDIRRVSEGMCVHDPRGRKVAVSLGGAAK